MNFDKLPYKLKMYLSLSSDRAVIDRFSGLKSAQEKVDFCINLLKEDNGCELLCQDDGGKNETKAQIAYDNAMELLQVEKYHKALLKLNECLCFVPNDSKLLAKIYAHRAKIFFNIKLLEACMENVNWSIEYDGLNDPDLELDRIRTKCINSLMNGTEIIQKNEEQQNTNTLLSYTAHENIPFIADCIQLKMDKVYGRHLITTRDLKPGDVIMVEQPFAPVIDPYEAGTYRKCNNCLSFNFYNLIPCPDCTGAMFCSTKCYQLGVKRSSHKYECSIVEKLQKWFNGESMVALKLILLALSAFPDLNDFRNLSNAVNASVENQFTFDFKNPDYNTIFKTICSLTTIEGDRNTEDLFGKSQIAAIFYELLMQNDTFMSYIKSGGHEAFIKELLYQFLQTTTINTFNMWSEPEMTPKANPDHTITDFGISSYPLSSFLSHSCAPNVRKARAGENNEIMLIFAVRPVKAGEKICDCYDQKNNHLYRGLEERRAFLYEQYYFVCQCEACIADYPTENDLKQQFRESEWQQMKESVEYTDDETTVVKNYEHLCSFLTEYDHYYPSKEVIEAQSYLHKYIKHFCTKSQFQY